MRQWKWGSVRAVQCSRDEGSETFISAGHTEVQRRRIHRKTSRALCWLFGQSTACILIGSDWQSNHRMLGLPALGSIYSLWPLLLQAAVNIFISVCQVVLLFSPSASFSFGPSWCERGAGLRSAAELRFSTSSGMVEPLKDNSGILKPAPYFSMCLGQSDWESILPSDLHEVPSNSNTSQRLRCLLTSWNDVQTSVGKLYQIFI